MTAFPVHGLVVEPIYYGDTSNPPTFARMLPGAIGYIATNGQTVLYGTSPLMRLMRSGWGGGGNTVTPSKEPDTVTIIPLSGPALAPILASDVLDNPVRYRGHRRKPLSARFKQCTICRDTTELTRHHTRPFVRGQRRSGPVIRICRPCHNAVHALFTNEELHETLWSEVVRVVRLHLPEASDTR